MTVNVLISRLREDAERLTNHKTMSEFRAAKKRYEAWSSLTNDEKRKALAFAEEDLGLLDVAMDDLIEQRLEAARTQTL